MGVTSAVIPEEKHPLLMHTDAIFQHAASLRLLLSKHQPSPCLLSFGCFHTHPTTKKVLSEHNAHNTLQPFNPRSGQDTGDLTAFLSQETTLRRHGRWVLCPNPVALLPSAV